MTHGREVNDVTPGTSHVAAWFFRFLQNGSKRKNCKTRDFCSPGNRLLILGQHIVGGTGGYG